MGHEQINTTQRDYFLEHPPMQPKAEIGAYVESQGILVPQRFKNLKEAMLSGKEFIIRSEHPQDYDGASGLIDSVVVSRKSKKYAQRMVQSTGGVINWKKNLYVDKYKIEAQVLYRVGRVPQNETENEIIKLSQLGIKGYARLNNLPLKTFVNDISFSYWEYINGRKQTIVADSSIKNRWHIFTRGENDSSYSYILFDKDTVEREAGFGENPEENPTEAVIFYETIRNLEKFDKGNVPLIEFVIKDGKRFYLQSHRSRDFEPATFELTRDVRDGEYESQFVRGATPPGGIICKTNFWYEDAGFKAMPRDEEASFDYHHYFPFTEVMAPKRKVQFIQKYDYPMFILETMDNHLSKTKLFKPGVSVFVSKKQMTSIFPELDYDDENSFINKHEKIEDLYNFSVNMSIESDGRRAIIKRV